ncbi:hypothetical protein AAFF_G00128280 [Aldrovandia affinis]|uniref:Senescence domain-containing protein n=1 Tax=Aldrovandia affinis TaxID=143900 RepID=A0AAD7T2A6_9TELE|nr:hypothetical protein AAFF_G00128280 [Aldrovandia affinis]
MLLLSFTPLAFISCLHLMTCPHFCLSLSPHDWPFLLAPPTPGYGAEAGQATDSGVNCAINVGMAAYNFDHLGIKAIVKTVGKKTARAVLEESKTQGKGGQEEEYNKREE